MLINRRYPSVCSSPLVRYKLGDHLLPNIIISLLPSSHLQLRPHHRSIARRRNHIIVVCNYVVMVVHHDCQRLAQNNRSPDHQITPPRTVVLLHELGNVAQRNLGHHPHKRPDLERLQRHTDQILVEEGAQEEDGEAGRELSIAHAHDGNVQVTDAPPMNGHVPGAPERVNVVRVPPVAVEVPVGELQDLAEQVHKRVEHQVEEAQPDEVVWDLWWWLWLAGKNGRDKYPANLLLKPTHNQASL